MGFSARTAMLLAGVGAAGATIDAAWRGGLWGLAILAAVVAIWCAGLVVAVPRGAAPAAAIEARISLDDIGNRMLLDVAPVPMVAFDRSGTRALNRAARRLFATDERIVDAPAALLDPASAHLRHRERHWRVDRVLLGDPAGGRMVAALVDVEAEQRIAEARTAAEMIQVLGHELLNGLAPIASLAESGEARLADPRPDVALLREILGTIARRAEGLRGFAEAYRALSRLPPPHRRPVALGDLTADLARLFDGCWPAVTLCVDCHADTWSIDGDQVAQALWALLQNAAEAAGDGGEVRLAVQTGDASLVFDVVDNGPGLAPGEGARIFRPFYTTKTGGTGIGLGLARQVAHAHGGDLALQDGAPTTFRMLLPRVS